ncbi:acetylornithine deacetylase [Halomonas salipaludis]|uniref:Acetylornithine deacetylase n=1 Tax=Halomonas salipaludis TaxID=2032625 RepID=A0A2A2F4E3_9GAMM|nr:acetylornithine deacetylase [Halomonas salipaludis]PAU79472.1 acetylornithine deacetylase [Halomonas salipaludis]
MHASAQPHPRLDAAISHLADLIGFDTTSAYSNLAIIAHLRTFFAELGAEVTVLPDASGEKANLVARLGPADVPGIVLSGHTDVVPANPKSWQSDPFCMEQRGSRLYGRGTCDMKGFAACVMAAAPAFAEAELKRPLYFCFSHDEEVGCLGAPAIARHLAELEVPPALAIIGEPSEMQLINGQKGKIAMQVTVHGEGGHSSFAPQHVNAVEYAARIIAMIGERSRRYEREGPFDHDFSVPHATALATIVEGGVATNVTPDSCHFIFELRSIDQEAASGDMQALIHEVEAALLPEMRALAPAAGIEWQEIFSYPAMGDATHSEMFKQLEPILPPRGGKVSYGSEGGVFEIDGGIPSIIIGPGSIRQAHKPDEFIEIDQLGQCLAFFDELDAWMRR